jgi:Fe-S-cluster containining protein
MKEARWQGYRIPIGRLAEQAELALQEGMTREKWREKKLPCVFLDENKKCAIYDMRPILCRSELSLSPEEECKRSGGRVMRHDLGYNIAKEYAEVGKEHIRQEIPTSLGGLPLFVDRILNGGDAPKQGLYGIAERIDAPFENQTAPSAG